MCERKKLIKIKFVDFWEHWNENSNFIVNCLRKYYDVELTDNPDYVFFSTFNSLFEHMEYSECVKIFYTQEDVCPDFNYADYAMGYELMTFGDRYLWYPIFLVEERYKSAWELMKVKHLDNDNLVNRKFCSFVVSNGMADPIRDYMFKQLSLYRNVDSGGRYENNIGLPKGIEDKNSFTRQYKFSLCFENSSHPGYITEKIVEAFAAKTVPIYWGDPCISNIFNPKAFINVADFSTIEDAIERIKKIDLNDELYYEMLNEVALNDNSLHLFEKKHLELEAFLLNIFEQDYSKAFRRNRVFWGKIYEDRYKNMKKAYVLLKYNPVSKILRKIRGYFQR